MYVISFVCEAPSTMDISQTGLLACGSQRYVQIWKDPFISEKAELYLRHEVPR